MVLYNDFYGLYCSIILPISYIRIIEWVFLIDFKIALIEILKSIVFFYKLWKYNFFDFLLLYFMVSFFRCIIFYYLFFLFIFFWFFLFEIFVIFLIFSYYTLWSLFLDVNFLLFIFFVYFFLIFFIRNFCYFLFLFNTIFYIFFLWPYATLPFFI